MSSTTEYHETSWDQYQEYRMTYCYICEYYTYAAYMEKHEDGNFYCDKCAFMPPYSDALYNGIVGLQRLFRAYFAKKAKPCGKCGEKSMRLYDMRKDMSPLCYYCTEEVIDEMRREYEEDEEEECSDCGYQVCHCHDHEGEDQGPCEDCGNPHECVCLEQMEDARLARHRRACHDPECDGTCGTLDCGCIDVCRGRCGTRAW